MTLYVYDVEVFTDDWIVIFKNPESDNHIVIHNDPHRLRAFIDQPDIILTGFNIKGYDNHIIKVIYYGGSNVDVKRCNDWIIGGGKGFEYPFLQYKKTPFDFFDLRDDLPKELSLKAIEGNLKLPIVESSVSFDIDRALTPEELAEVIEYCKYDVDSTIKLYYERKEDYIDAKALVGEMYGLSYAESIKPTNATLSAKVLEAEYKERNDEREYVVPENVDISLIPDIVYNFFMQIRDKSIPYTKLFGEGKGSKGATLRLWIKTARGSCPVTYAWGGVHGAKPCVTVEETADRVIVNQDVASLYPNSMINFGYCSRSMKDPKAFEKLVKRRLEYKRAGDKKRANALKLVVNTVYGAMLLNGTGDLVDRLSGRSVCITNQLCMTMLIVSLAQQCESIDFVNINTDGIMFTIDRNEVELSQKIIDDWCEVTKFEMERDDFRKVIQKDVNNYIGITPDGKFKTKGGFVSLYNGGNFKTNSMSIIDKAVVEYLVNGTPPETTINNCTDIFAFQRIEKTGGTFEGSYQYVNGERVPIQKVNRIYAVNNPAYGAIVKGKWITEKRKKDKATGKMISTPVEPPEWSETSIQDCPDHAFIDNENVLTVNDIDKGYYIDMAKKRIDKYINLDNKVKRDLEKITEEVVIMATKKETAETLNVYAKLAVARQKFLESPVKKSGINRYAEYKYFELEDIVPVATSIFNELGLLFFIQFTKEDAIGTLVNTDNPEEKIIFNSPMIELTVLDKEGNVKPPAGMNSVQALGSSETYQRRYLYMACLDIVEADAFDATNGKVNPETAKAETATSKKSTKPKTTEEREEIKEELTNTEAQATETEIKAVKKGLKKLRDKDEKYEDYIGSILKLIKVGLTKKESEDLLIDIGEKIAE